MIACEEDSYVDYLQRPRIFGVAWRNGVRHEGLQVYNLRPFLSLLQISHQTLALEPSLSTTASAQILSKSSFYRDGCGYSDRYLEE
jgi:hypothetical protein